MSEVGRPVERYGAEPGPHAVEQRLESWHDEQRGRDVPVRLYWPGGPLAPVPVVIFSHGLGTSRDDYRYLGEHWASHGYLSVHLTHIGSDETALRGPGGLPPRRLADFLDDVPHRIDRPRDASFAIDYLSRNSDLARRVDLARIAVAGHSYGAYVAHALVGLTVDLPDRKNVSFTDPRVRAAIVMSPQSKDKFGLHPGSWNHIDVPVLSLTGTRDIEYGVGSAAPRRTSYDSTPGRDQYLVTIEGATHATFNDFRPLRISTKALDPAHHDYVRMATVAFLDAYLRDRAAAQQWLLSRALEQLSDGACRLEYKNTTPITPV